MLRDEVAGVSGGGSAGVVLLGSSLEFQVGTFRLQSKLLMSFALLVGALTPCGPMFGHHGSAAYKADKVVVLKQATVTRFMWANPHAILMFDVRDGKGNVSHWAGEAGSPSAVSLLGWTRNSLHAGDVITVHLYPSKFNSTVGRLDKIVLSDGTTLRDSPRGDRGVLSRY